jgi:hypothetical protein
MSGGHRFGASGAGLSGGCSFGAALACGGALACGRDADVAVATADWRGLAVATGPWLTGGAAAQAAVTMPTNTIALSVMCFVMITGYNAADRRRVRRRAPVESGLNTLSPAVDVQAAPAEEPDQGLVR